MSGDYATWAGAIRALVEALTALEPQAEALGVPAPSGDEWHQLLLHKLAPQTRGDAPLVVAVVGGTNIGKSAIFNQLAGENASAVSPLAAGTKHPVCLAPPNMADAAKLAPLFAGFTLHAWGDATDALRESEDDLLFWRESAALPPRLLLLDTPDIDSNAKVNWRRADVIRQTADVLVAILTQQKYNDAAVVKFFRHAAEADKAVIIVFNQVDLTHDREAWPLWTETFRGKTGVEPAQICVVPYDRPAAQNRGLTFHAVGRDGREFHDTPLDLRRELNELRYDELKTRTLRGALVQVLDPATGVERYLAAIRGVAARFASARDALVRASAVTVTSTPLPKSILTAEIADWWNERRPRWASTIHGAYSKLYGLAASAVNYFRDPPPDDLQRFAEEEVAAFKEIVGKFYDRLDEIADTDDSILAPRLRQIISGAARAKLLEDLERKYAELPPVRESFRHKLRARLDKLQADNPRRTKMLLALDAGAAVARPVISVAGLFVGVPGVDLLHLVGQAAIEQVVVPAGVEGVAKAGESLAYGGAGMFLADTQRDFGKDRSQFLSDFLNDRLIGSTMAELQRGAEFCRGATFAAAVEAVAKLRQLVR